ncbi:hypothetical protein NE236_27320 [Actinoallomurus purpureus]|uniref:helix-turn-helix domain-containing protein n=1 Tax=Actinoallomurus purpureus TaxID=478114 RepID=UPI002092C3E2|nr:helix-turn-helix domain-containing protein [Actinoallomurus purpureus]MCO6008690.1 hypothetical protein [Actinoallomurus purpureus]
MTRTRVSRTRQLRPLPEKLPETTRTLLEELRALKDRSGYDLRALEGKTYASRSSWGRWLSGETWIPCEAVETMAELCGGDKQRLRGLWHRADDNRRTPPATQPADGGVPPAEKEPEGATPEHTAPEGATRDRTAPEGTARTALEGAALDDTASVRPDAAASRRPGVPRRRMLHIGTTLGCSVAAGAIGLAAGLSHRPEPAQRPHPAPTYAQWITRPQILGRALTWNPRSDQRVPYDQSKNHGGFRTDGSGYASMALGLPAPGPNSTDLAWGGYTRQIPPSKLRPGDLIINATGLASTRQVAIFEKWANTAHTAYWVYQQRRAYGTDHLVLRYDMSENSPYHAYRPLNIHEQPAVPPS